jgi:hypothetical protein
MGKIADDLESLVKSTEDAIKLARTVFSGRTPDAGDNNKGQYPLRNVMEYIGGHRQVFDSTPGARVVEQAHGSGTFQQWAEDGSEIRVVVSNKYEHLKAGYTLTVNQNGDIKIDGHCRVSVGGGAHVEVAGDVSLVSTGTITQYAAKDINLVAGGKINILGNKSLNLTTDGTHTVRVGKDHKSTVHGKSDYIVDGNHTSAIQGNSDNLVKGNIGLRVDGNATTRTTGNESALIGGKKDVSSSGTMTFIAPKIDLNP